MKRLAVIIVNYKTPELTLTCVASLDARLPEEDFAPKIYIVENSSDDGSHELFSAAFDGRSDIEIIQSNRNDGYGAGNNLVLRSIVASKEFDYVWLLNPDTVLLTGIPEQVQALLAQPRTAAVGARLEDPDSTPQNSAFRFPSFLSEFLQAANLGILDRWFGRWRVVQPMPDTVASTDWLAGASVIFKVEALRDVGIFDEAYFLYFEEVDLFRRLDAAGWQSWYAPEMRLIHHVGASTGISDHRRRKCEMPDYWYASRSRFFRKQHGAIGAVCVDLCWLAGRCIYLFSRLLLRRRDSSAVKGCRILAFNPLIRTRRDERLA